MEDERHIVRERLHIPPREFPEPSSRALRSGDGSMHARAEYHIPDQQHLAMSDARTAHHAGHAYSFSIMV